MKSVSQAKSVSKSSLVLAVLSFIVLAALPAVAETGSARTVKYSQQDIVSVRAKVRFSTLIVLPQNEEILDYATGDKEFWIINGAHNLCYIHPAQAWDMQQSETHDRPQPRLSVLADRVQR